MIISFSLDKYLGCVRFFMKIFCGENILGKYLEMELLGHGKSIYVEFYRQFANFFSERIVLF